MRERGKQIYSGTFIHARSLHHIEYLHNTLVCVEGGKIILVHTLHEGEGMHEKIQEIGWNGNNVEIVKTEENNQFFFPGFIGRENTHTRFNRSEDRKGRTTQ